MSRPVFLIVYPRTLFKAHWALWVPLSDDPDMGTVIHAAGDARAGFQLEFKRDYSPYRTQRSTQVIPVASLPEQYVSDWRGDGQVVIEKTARDHIEEIALSVPAPGPSLNSINNPPPGVRVQIQDCQTWVKDYIAELVRLGLMTPEATQTIMSAPMH